MLAPASSSSPLAAAPLAGAPSEEHSRQVAEDARESIWASRSFLQEMFGGGFDLGILTSVPAAPSRRPVFQTFYDALKAFMEQNVDSDRIDSDGQYPP